MNESGCRKKLARLGTLHHCSPFPLCPVILSISLACTPIFPEEQLWQKKKPNKNPKQKNNSKRPHNRKLSQVNSRTWFKSPMLLPAERNFRRFAYGITSSKNVCLLALLTSVAGHVGVLATVQDWHSNITLLLSPSTWNFRPKIFFIKNTLAKLICNKIKSAQ